MLFRIFIISFTVFFLNANTVWADNHNSKYHHVSNPENLKKKQEVKTTTPETSPKEKEEKEETEEIKPTENEPKHNKYYRIAK